MEEKKPLKDVRHPFWAWSRDILLLAGLLWILKENCNTFDATEWTAFGAFASMMLGVNGLHRKLKKMATKKEDAEEASEDHEE